MSCDPDQALIRKEIVYPGTKNVDFKPGTKVRFHYVTKTLRHSGDGGDTGGGHIIDDSRKTAQPMELVLGKSFKLECWEVMVQKMAVNEVARFRVDKSLLPQYPFISKTIRDARKPKEDRKHCCGMTVQTEGLGYGDLNELMSEPCDLEFTFELLSAELPDQYEREAWQLNDDEKLGTVVRLRAEGNAAYKAGDLAAAEADYCRAIGMLEQLMLKERPQDDEWQQLCDVKMPLLLNYAQCKLLAGDFYAVIAHCTEVLKHQPDNVKALFRRAKAHRGAWNPAEARADFERCVELDACLATSVGRDLAELAEAQRAHDLADKLKFQKIF